MKSDAISIRVAQPEEIPTLRRLMQFYCYDFSEMVAMSLDDNGVFGSEAYIDDLFGPGHTTFLARLESTPIGFAIVTTKSYLTNDDGIFDMTEFFVMRQHRRNGVGMVLAQHLFSNFRGPWEIRVEAANLPAVRFWRSTVSSCSGGEYTEQILNSDRHTGTLFCFTSTEREELK